MLHMFKKARYISVPHENRETPYPPAVEPKATAVTKSSLPRLSAPERISMTADCDSFLETDRGIISSNPLGFEGYSEKTSMLREKTGLQDGVVSGYCRIGGVPALIGVMDSRFMMGSMGSVVGERFTRLFERGADELLPIVLFCASGGARMQEGILSLMQMAKVSAAVARHHEEGQLYVAVLTDPTTGGVTASFAMLGDIILAEPGVTIGFAGRRVIEGTLKARLPETFQTSEFSLEHGFADRIVPRHEMKDTLKKLLCWHRLGGHEV
ncbi:MAG: acetyl-CoA carboxylase carboxyl transferase subunit beta [Oscillospiraceae bacterium]|nr:acetyl-CoA carboxylase carboxyl transferase subunit beta [Oscillospiraceae bacterium]